MKLKLFDLLFVLLCVAFLSGCATPKYNYVPQARHISEPQLDVVTTAHVGEEIARQGTLNEQEALHVEASIKVGSFAYTILPGYYKKTGEDERSEYYIPYSGSDSGQIVKKWFVDPWKSIEVSKKEQKIGIVTIFNLHGMEEATGFNRVKKSFQPDDSFLQTLLYNGRVGNTIRLGYREFWNNEARPSVSNDVEYDIAESKMVSYKGARIEILEATNQYIKYMLIRNFKTVD